MVSSLVLNKHYDCCLNLFLPLYPYLLLSICLSADINCPRKWCSRTYVVILFQLVH